MKEAGFFGKHPAFGDFVSSGLPPDLRDELQNWLTGCLAQSAPQFGDHWAQVWDACCPIRFWIGGHVLSSAQGIKGVIAPSRDKVGRRFPLVVVGALAQNEASPVQDTTQKVYEFWEEQIRLSDGVQVEKVRNLLPLAGFQGLSQPLAPDTVWATNPVVDISNLLKAVEPVDHARAAAGRSYWWTKPTGTRQGAIWTCEGLPSADAMVWLLGGVSNQAGGRS